MTLEPRSPRRPAAASGSSSARLVLGAIAVILLATAGCSTPAPEEVDTTSAVPVKTVAAATGAVRGLIHATGTVNPAPGAELVVIAPEPARIADIAHAEGDRVRQGDVLVRFDIPNTAAEVQRQLAEGQRAQATLANAKANQTRERDLFERGVAARKEVEDADRAVADADAAVAQADASRAAASATAARSVVTATFDGIIARRYHNPGDLVDAAASDPVLRVIDPRRLEVAAAVPLADAPRIVLGAHARLVGGQPGRPEVTLRVISRPAAVDPGTGTIPVRLAFTGPVTLPAGTPVQLELDAEQHTGVVIVPVSALVREADETAVFVAMGGKAHRRAVVLGLSDGAAVEVASGVTVGDQVIVDGQAGLPDGAAITIGGDDAPDGESPDAPAAKDDEK